MDSFEAQFDSAFAKNLAYLKKARNTAVVAVGTKIISETPVYTGDLKGSWRSTVDAPSSDMDKRRDETGQLPIDELKRTVEQWPDEGSLFMTNNLPYAEGVEFDQYSTKRPQGMVRVNIEGFGSDFIQFTTGTGRTE